MHYKVFLDTNIYDAASYSFQNGLFTQLRNYAQSGRLELQINSIVEGEVNKHITKNIGDSVKELNRILTSRPLKGFLSIPEFEPMLTIKNKTEWIEAGKKAFEQLLADCNTERIVLNGVDMDKIFHDYFNLILPFEQGKKEEFPDAVIIQSIIAEIEELSTGGYYADDGKVYSVFKDIRTKHGGTEELQYCIVSGDNGFRKAIAENIKNRRHKDILLFNELNEMINYIEIQNENTKALQEKFTGGFGKEIIEDAIKDAIEDVDYDIYEFDGEVEEVNILQTDNITYEASVIGVKEPEEGWSTVRLYIISHYDAFVHYVYIDEERSIWDEEEKKYLWVKRMDKIVKCKIEAPLTIELRVESDEDGDPIDSDMSCYIDRPYQIDIGHKDIIEEVYCGAMPEDENESIE